MILYKKAMASNAKQRPSQTIDVSIDELPEREVYTFRTPKERVKFIKQVEATCRKSMEYKDYMRFLKRNTDLKRCTVLKGLNTEGGKKYTIEIHHEPFTLFDIVETVLNKREMEGMKVDPLDIADEVMGLHYDGKVGLIHLSTTMHQLVHDDKIFIPLQYIYQSFNQFYSEYKPYFNPLVIEKIEMKVEMSLRTDNFVSDSIDPQFTYIHIDGFDFPEIPEEWKDVLHMEAAANNINDSKNEENVIFIGDKKVIEA